MELTERKKKILATVVEQYVRTGEPIGSKVLMEYLPFSVSSATIRNEMSDLAQMGYLEQPHTSAGRVPTEKGYRYYVDNLMGETEIGEEERAQIRRGFGTNIGDPEKLLERAGEILAKVTNCATVATTPTDAAATVKRIEIVPIGRCIAMIVLMTSTGIIKNGVCRTDVPITEEMITCFTEIAEEKFIGMRVSDIGMVMIQTLVASLGSNALIMSPLFVLLSSLASRAVQAEVRLKGRQNLLNHREYSSNAYEMMSFLTDDSKLERVMSSGTSGLQVVIGSENMYRQLENSSMIIARYTIQGHDGGAIGIIGPTRLDYARLIPRIRYITDLVGRILTDTLENNEEEMT